MFIFGARAPKEMRERSARLVLRIEIQQIHRNLVFFKVRFGKANDEVPVFTLGQGTIR